MPLLSSAAGSRIIFLAFAVIFAEPRLWAGQKTKVIIAHRGASGYALEHSLAALTLAHSMNPDYIEPDLVLTKDGIPIVLHDLTLEATTDVAEKFPGRKSKDGHFYAIDFSLAEIKTLRLVPRREPGAGKLVFPERHFPYKGLEIITFEEFLLTMKGLNTTRERKIGIYPEVKNPSFHARHGKDLSRETLQLLKKHWTADGVGPLILQCFDAVELKRIRKLQQEYGTNAALVQLIADDSWGEAPHAFSPMLKEEGLKEIATYAEGIGLYVQHLLQHENARNYLARANHLGLSTHVYTLRKDLLPAGWAWERLLQHLFQDLGVDGAFTDFPDRLSSWLVDQAGVTAGSKK